MLDIDRAIYILGLMTVVSPVLLTAVIGLAALVDRPLSERGIARVVYIAVVTGLTAALLILVFMLWSGKRQVPIQLGAWVQIPEYEFSIKFVFDRLSVPFVILSYLLCGTIGAFATRYMHREAGFSRFFALFTLFLLGMTVTSLAGTIETLFAGWELVGLSSALLVAFFHERPMPCRNGLRVWTVYRVSDAALLIASIILHHLHTADHHSLGEFSYLLGGEEGWPFGKAPHLPNFTPTMALIVGLLLIVAAAGKSALVPFSGWLPRAMEGPTPSSAVFYGALSVHLGAFLLLRFSALIELSPVLGVVIIVLGLVTAMFAAFATSVQTDIKCALSFASLTQVGIIVVEIGIGIFWPDFRYVPLIHIIGHACLRTLQFIRAPTLLHDYRILENALGEHISHPPKRSRLSDQLYLWFYRFGVERGYLDSMLSEYIVKPFLAVLRAFDRAERWWIGLLSGTRSDAQHPKPQQVSLNDDI